MTEVMVTEESELVHFQSEQSEHLRNDHVAFHSSPRKVAYPSNFIDKFFRGIGDHPGH
jgi:hypothetical protein